MTAEHDERRKSPRIPCHDVWLEIKVCDQDSIAPPPQLPSHQVRVGNISDGGICLIAQKPFNLGQIVYFFDPKLPSRGTVVWACQSRSECKAGIQFSSE